jgi:hypothetical protein
MCVHFFLGWALLPARTLGPICIEFHTKFCPLYGRITVTTQSDRKQ